MSFKKYLSLFIELNNPEGYVSSCRFLAFDNGLWKQFSEYKNSIGKHLEKVKNATKKEKIAIADLCCGEYSWIPRHFDDYANVIYAIDKEEVALNSAFKLSKKVQRLKGDGNEKLLELPKGCLEFLYCGFNMYEHFVQGIDFAIANKGGFFIMKPKSGDDLYLRNLFTESNVEERVQEIYQITNNLRQNFDVKYEERKYSWSFEIESLDQILAAISIVCLGSETGKKRPLSNNEYKLGMEFLVDKIDNNILTLKQNESIWKGLRQ